MTMANPIPCGVCGEVADSDLLVSDRTPEFQILGQSTMGMCVQCFIERGMLLANALQAAYAEMEKAGDQPGLLESVEADEGEVTPADPLPPAPKSKKTKEPAETPESNGTQTEAANVDG